jgi:CRP-like cAMP-binding protein
MRYNMFDTDLIESNIARHIQLNPEEMAYFRTLLKYKKIKKGGFLLREGDICKYENFVVKGCLKTYSIDANGYEHILQFSIEDWWAGDMYSFLSNTPSNLNIEALEDTEVVQIAKADLENLYQKVPKFDRFFRILLQNAFVAHQQRITQSLSFSAEERYLYLRTKYPVLEKRIAQKHIAAYLGITPVFLSMIRRKLAKT